MNDKKTVAFIRNIISFAFLLALLIGCAAVPHQPEKIDDIRVTILFFNDLHGHLKPFEVQEDGKMVEVGGIARLAGEVARIRKQNLQTNTQTIVLVAGDILQGTPMSTIFKGEPTIKSLNAMGVDAMTVGNHEFDFGLANFLRLKQQARFPFLSANIVDKESGRLITQPSVSIPLAHGVSLTVIGVTTKALLTTTKADNVATLSVLDSVEAVRKVYVPAMADGPVLLLSHSRHQTDRAIAHAMPNLVAIVGGHDQILFSPCRMVGKVPIFQAYEKGRFLGRIDLAVNPFTKQARLIDQHYIEIAAELPEDTEIANIVADYDARLGEQFKEVLGRSLSYMDGERGRIRYEETALGNFITDIMVMHTGAPIAMINAGALRSSIKPGPVTVADVFTAMPYANELVIVEMSGWDIERALVRAVQGDREDEDGGFLHVAGLTFEVSDKAVNHIRVGPDRRLLIRETVYRVAVPDFLATGGDGHNSFVGKPQTRTGLPLRELFVDTIRDQGIIDARVEGRIRRLD